ncbi:MAG: ligase-associated DNA damage response endonuclease PdeM [Micavibrio aeruginosavorus]|uniref:Ligase-associated DNA damage response endonuclease PdeM n=1 Tax=Micavibrio aeruginosavorus TaxID=349221 RepID=A0A2W4ZN31_9BACT|nr:MAG: ligase-associated DNA damage response endonuclease PdeM [Micavibrio aeruginosavorus]
MNINFAGHDFVLHPLGVLFWPEKSMLIVSDMHLEKGSHFARKGFFLPPYDTHETLARLMRALDIFQPARVLFLGDTFHDAGGYHRLPVEERKLFDHILEYEPIWITGNHDGDYAPAGFSAFRSLTISDVTFNHETVKDVSFEISGHYHPKVDILHKNARISRACFIEDGNRMIMPAFGSYTGGISVTDTMFKNILEKPRVYALGDKIYALK